MQPLPLLVAHLEVLGFPNTDVLEVLMAFIRSEIGRATPPCKRFATQLRAEPVPLSAFCWMCACTPVRPWIKEYASFAAFAAPANFVGHAGCAGYALPGRDGGRRRGGRAVRGVLLWQHHESRASHGGLNHRHLLKHKPICS